MAQPKSLAALHHIHSQHQLGTGILLGKEKEGFEIGKAREKIIAYGHGVFIPETKECGTWQCWVNAWT